MKRTSFTKKGLIPVFILMLVWMTACSNGGGNNNGSANGDNDSGNSGGEKEVSLRFSWWGGEDRHVATLKAIDLYMEQNPNVHIEAEYGGFDGYQQKLSTQFAGGTAPDLVQLATNFAADYKNMLLDFDTVKDQIDTSKFQDSFLENYASIDGMWLGMPMGVNGSTIIYNKDFLKEFNIPEDTVWNWDNLVTVGEQVQSQDAESYLLNMDLDQMYRLLLQPYVNQRTGNQWINDDFTTGFDEAALTDAFTYIKTLLDKGIIQPFQQSSLYQGEPWLNPKWLQGDMGMLFALASNISAVQTDDIELGVARSPIAEDAKTSSVLITATALVGVNKDSEHIDEAVKFANWLVTDEEAAKILGTVRSVPPVQANSDILTQEGSLDANVAKAVELALSDAGNPVNVPSNDVELGSVAKSYLERVGFGADTPEVAAKAMMKEYADLLDDLKAAAAK
ncbi:extracellular solute-binding protein [Paenibacillus sp. HB172176]|uniref:ABC transporter substrate-binding protein n=1 Tax=Paenibacillus sp. HB172176 TaxID=2493690 RepID=UPI00143C24AE|nr:extracellular solute-binding protein [Paenibacillus sp. HB172176]